MFRPQCEIHINNINCTSIKVHSNDIKCLHCFAILKSNVAYIKSMTKNFNIIVVPPYSQGDDPPWVPKGIDTQMSNIKYH